MTPVIVEICVEDVAGALAAREGGASRLELAAGLAVGGLTPGPGMLAAVRKAWPAELVALLRPRPGDFHYRDAEFEVLENEIRAARDAGADGVAVGVLDTDGTVDRERMARLVRVARPMSVTLHRAFDLTRDLDEALEAAIALGVDRVLTSGGSRAAPGGTAAIRRLVAAAGTRIGIVAGGGVRAENVRSLVAGTGVREVHLSARALEPGPMRHRNDAVALHGAAIPGEYERARTDAAAIRRVVEALSDSAA